MADDIGSEFDRCSARISHGPRGPQAADVIRRGVGRVRRDWDGLVVGALAGVYGHFSGGL